MLAIVPVIALLLPWPGTASETRQGLRDAMVLAADNADQAVNDALHALADDPSDPRLIPALTQALIQRGQFTGDASRYEAALRVVDLLAKGRQADRLRAVAWLNLHRFGQAEVVLQRYAGAGDRFDLLLGDVLMETGRLELARQAHERVLRASPGALIYGRSGLLHFLAGDVPGAIARNQAAVRASHPQDLALRSWLLAQAALYALAAGEADAALALAQAAVDEAPSVSARWTLGRAKWAAGDGPGAIAVFDGLAVDYPAPEVLWWLHDALVSLGQSRRAASVAARIDELGDRIDPRGYAAWLVHREENLVLSRRLIREELDQRQDARTRYLWARLEHAAGRIHAAREALFEALALGLPDPELYQFAADLDPDQADAYCDRAAGLALLQRPGRAMTPCATTTFSQASSPGTTRVSTTPHT